MSDFFTQDFSFGKNLKALRKRAGLSQEKAAAELQLMGMPMSREVISRMELGRHGIKVSVLLALKEIYASSISDFFRDL